MVQRYGEGPDDWFFDEYSQRWLRHSGVAHWRRRLAEQRAKRDPQWHAKILDRLGIDPALLPARRVFRAPLPSGYAGPMRRPDIELTDEAARFVERHPEVIARLAEQEPVDDPAPKVDDVRRSRFREYIRERRAAAGTPEAASASQAFLARYSG